MPVPIAPVIVVAVVGAALVAARRKPTAQLVPARVLPRRQRGG